MPNDNPADQSPINFLDNPKAPDVFADGYSGLWVHGGCMRIALEAARYDHTTTPGPINRVMIGRLVMPVQQAEWLARNILELIERLKNDPTPAPQGRPPSSLN